MHLMRKLPILLLGLVIALLFGEAFVRVMAPEPLLPRNVTGSPWGIRQNVPGASYRQVTEDVDVGFRINSQGLRADRDYAMKPPPGTCRIAITGDSFIAGYEAEAADTIAGRLDAEMAKRGYRTETLNFGVSGLGNAEQLIQFEKRILPFRPMIFVQGFHRTDFDDNQRSGLFALTPEGRLEQRANSYLPGVAISDRMMAIPPYAWLDAHSQLFSAFRQKATDGVKKMLRTLRDPSSTVKTNQKKQQAEQAGAAGMAGAMPGEALTGALLRETKQRAEAVGVDWYLLGIPTREGKAGYIEYSDRLGLTPEMRRHYVTPIDRFTGPDGARYYRPHGHGHFSEIGNAISAQMLADRIAAESQGKLAACRMPGAAVAGTATTGAAR